MAVFPELGELGVDPAGHEGLNASIDLPRWKAEASGAMEKAFTMTAISC